VRTQLLVSEKPNNFDAIRIAMAFLVVWSHSFALYFGTESRELISRLTHGSVNAGNVAVDVFFVISGFLITKSFERSRSWWTYLKKRVARIYPAYLVATSLCAFVLLPLYAGIRYSPRAIVNTIGLNLMLRNWFVSPDPFIHNHIHALNGSLWSIPIEFWCYIGVLAFGLLRLSRLFLAATFGVIVGAHVWTVGTGKVWGGGILALVVGWPNIWFQMAPFFIAGMLCYLYRDRIPRSGWVAAGGLLFFTILSWTLPLVGQAVLPAALAYAVLHWAFAPRVLPAARFGDFSYGSYLYAFPIQQLLLSLTTFRFTAFVATSMALTLCAGVMSWFVVERWFHRTREVTLHVKATEGRAQLRGGPPVETSERT